MLAAKGAQGNLNYRVGHVVVACLDSASHTRVRPPPQPVKCPVFSLTLPGGGVILTRHQPLAAGHLFSSRIPVVRVPHNLIWSLLHE